MNDADYVIRGRGFIKSVHDLEMAVVKVTDNVPLYIKDVATVSEGPAFRQGALNKAGAEAVGGVVVARFAENPLQVIKNVKAKIKEISPSLPKKTLADGSVSQVKIVPFYDRTQLIYETLDTLKRALSEEILVTIIIVVVMVNHLVSAALISLILPLAILVTFIVMKLTGVEANIMALSGIAIAIGVMVDMGIILTENILRHLEQEPPGKSIFKIVHEAASQVGGAVITSASTTILAFLPVFTLTGPEGKLFTPVALTKTFAIAASLILALSIIPPLAHIVFTKRNFRTRNSDGGLWTASGFRYLDRIFPVLVCWNRRYLNSNCQICLTFPFPIDQGKNTDGHQSGGPCGSNSVTYGALAAPWSRKRIDPKFSFLRRYHFRAPGDQEGLHRILSTGFGVDVGPQGHVFECPDHPDHFWCRYMAGIR